MQEALKGLSGFARVTLTGELSADIDFRPRDFSTVDSGLDSAPVVVVGAVHVVYDFESIREERTVRGEFVQEVWEQDLPEEEKRRILVTGLRALDGRDDLEVT